MCETLKQISRKIGKTLDDDGRCYCSKTEYLLVHTNGAFELLGQNPWDNSFRPGEWLVNLRKPLRMLYWLDFHESFSTVFRSIGEIIAKLDYGYSVDDLERERAKLVFDAFEMMFKE